MKPDYPYYAGSPVSISGPGWLLVVAAVVAAFLALSLLPLPDFPLNLLPAVVFTGLPLLVLMAVTGWRPPAIFRSLSLGQVATGLGFGVLTIGVSFAVGLGLSQLTSMTPNTAATAMSGIGTGDLLWFLARTFVQLIGEEVVTVLPLLAVLWLCVQKFGLSRRVGLIIAVVVSTLWFSAMHLPTYDWNLLQCFGIIGTARVMLTLCYLLTRNVWVSAIAHIVNDWSMFLFVFGVSHLPIGTETAQLSFI